MAEDYEKLIKQLCFNHKTIPYGGSKTIIFHNVLGAVWTIEIFFCQRFGLLPIDFQSRRLLLKLKCENMKRKVYLKTNIRISLNSSTELHKEELFHNYIITGDSFLELVTDSKNFSEETVHSLKVSAKFDIYVNAKSYIYYKQQQSMCLLPEESQLETIHLEIMRELSDDFLASLSEQENASDVVLRCESKDYKAHKFVLSARSKVFSAMFHKTMKESESNMVDMNEIETNVAEIKDIETNVVGTKEVETNVAEVKEIENNVVEIKEMSSETFKDVLEYIYSGKVTTFNDKNAYELVPAAETYDLPGLKKLSLYYIHSKLSLDNALSTLIFAKLHDEDLKNKTIDFICMEFENLKNTEEWDIFRNKEPLLANEVLSKMIKFVNSDKKKTITSKKPAYISKKKIINHLTGYTY